MHFTHPLLFVFSIGLQIAFVTGFVHAQNTNLGSTITVHEINFYDNSGEPTNVEIVSGLLEDHPKQSSITISGSGYSAFVFTFEVGPDPLMVSIERIGQGLFIGDSYWDCFDPECGCLTSDCLESIGYPEPNSAKDYVLEPGLYRYNLNCYGGGAGLRFVWEDTSRDPQDLIAPCCLPSGCAELDETTCFSLGGTWLDEGQACSACPVSCEGDFNGDGKVDGFDLGVLLASWGVCATEP
jgi:hypothetical protein